MYSSARPTRLREVWDSGTKSGERLTIWYASLLAKVMNFIEEESNHMSALFGTAKTPELLCTMIQNVLAPVRPLLAQRLVV